MASAESQWVARQLREAAELLQAQGANPFRIAAYRKAAASVENCEDLRGLTAEKGAVGLACLPGIGAGLASAIAGMVETGRFAILEPLRGELDAASLFRTVPRIGPELAQRIHEALDVETLEALEAACHDGRLQRVPGVGVRRAAMVGAALAQMLDRRRGCTIATGWEAEPPVAVLLDVDREYRHGATAGSLPRIAPRRFNPDGAAWLPVLHTQRGKWHFTALFSNTARAHRLARTRDWVVLYFDNDDHGERQRTIVTQSRGVLAGRRVVRGRERECEGPLQATYRRPQQVIAEHRSLRARIDLHSGRRAEGASKMTGGVQGLARFKAKMSASEPAVTPQGTTATIVSLTPFFTVATLAPAAPAGNTRMARATAARTILAVALALLSVVDASPSRAVPAYARQTGQECIACHVSFPELTPYGRYFKLTGYTIGKPAITSEGLNYLPLAVMAQASVTNTRNNHTIDPDTGETVEVTDKNNQLAFTGASLFLAGKINDYLGGFVQWTYDNLATTADGTLGGHSGIDNTDIRIVGRYSGPEAAQPDWIYGFTLHNNPTVQDVWNSTPAFGFPFTTAPLANTPSAATQIDGTLAQQVAGLGGYVFWKKTLYGELSFYRTADGAFSFLRKGQDIGTEGGVAALKGYNPYWRLAYSHDWGPNSLMVGTYGMVVDRFPSNLDQSTPTDRFRDIAVDAQYQYITDPHTFTAQATFIHERQSYGASFPVFQQTGSGIGAGPTPANPTDTLRTFKAKATYYRDRKYGGTLAYFSTTGNADAGLYGVDAAGNARRPDSSGYIFELDYLPIQYVRLMLQYTLYTKFNGASTNYDGTGRNARDNNTLFLNVWVAF